MAPKIEKVTESFTLGEGPHWDADRQVLYFVDMYGKYLVKYTPSTNKTSKVSVAPNQPSLIIPVEGKKDQFLVTLNNELTIISWDGENEKCSIIETLCNADNKPETPNNKFNDGKCDSSGRLWVGTYGISKEGFAGETNVLPMGTLYSFDSKRRLQGHVDKIRCTNGMAFNEQIKKMYYIDSFKYTIDQFDFDVSDGTITNRQVLFTLKNHNITKGAPDGMTIDTDGNLWVALFENSTVIKIDGKKPETLLDTIKLPTPQVTSVAFGGPNLDELYVTTGVIEFNGQKPPPSADGATYRVSGIGSKGFPGVNFKL